MSDTRVATRPYIIGPSQSFFVVQASTVVGGYVGPGDIAAASVWWGLRAYSNATVGSNAIRLRRGADAVSTDIPTVAGGGLDTAAITAFSCGATTFGVETIYDQTGGAQNVGFTAGLRATFVVSTNPISTLGGPAYSVNCLSGNGPTGTLTTALGQPLTIMSAARFNNTSGQDLIRATGTTFEQGAFLSAGNGRMYMASPNNAGTNSTTFGSSSPYAYLSLFSSAASQAQVNGATFSLTVNPGGSSFSAAVQLFEGAIGAQPFTGAWVETGIWTSDQTGTTTLSTNARGFWNF